MARGLNLFAAATAIRGRRRALWGLLALVAVVHGCVGQKVVDELAEAGTAATIPPRLEVAYVREMTPSAPPPAARPAAPPPRPKRRTAAAAAVPAAAASAAVTEPAPSPADAAPSAAPSADPSLAAEPPVVASEPPASAAAETVAAAEPAASSAAEPPAGFDWPVSTRVSYVLNGNYRGPVNGSANVEWIRVGTRYQVHLDMVVGPSFAPVITRRMTSDGAITAEGLAPRRYDQQTRVMGSDRPPVTLHFDPDGVVLANGNRTPSVPGVQDTASQFVQLSYVFGTRPELLTVGGTVDIPLALPHKVDVWTYDVVAEETLATPFGDLASIHLKPRRKSDRPDEMTAEIWFAPQIRYLPARIVIRQGSDNFLDLTISRRPEMAAGS